ncbi:MAG: hypothetical protein AB1Z19_07150 [Eubacteriales bacterium]
MRKLLLKLFGFLLLLWVLFAVAVYAFPKYMYNDEYGLYANTKIKTAEPHEVLILGDSRAQAGILADAFQSDVYSLALPGGTAVEGYYVLDEYLKNNPAPQAIIISYAPYHFELGETFWERAVKMDFLSLAQSWEVVNESIRLDDDIALRGGGLDGGVAQYGKLLLYKLKYPPYYMADVSSLLSQGAKNAERYDWVTEEVQDGEGQFYFGRADSTSATNSEAARSNFEESHLIYDYFDRILTRCEEEGITVYVFTAPMSQISCQAMSDAFVSGYQEKMAAVWTAHPEAMIDAAFNELPNDYFGDESHVNPKGAEWFTDYIKKATGIE